MKPVNSLNFDQLRPDQQLAIIVTSVMAPEAVDSGILRAYIVVYANSAGIPYNLAVANIRLHVIDRIQTRLNRLY